MTTLSNYIHGLFSTIASIGMRASGSGPVVGQILDPQPEGQSSPYTVQSMEIMVPMLVHGSALPTPPRPSKTIGLWLGKQTHEEIQRLMQLDEVPQLGHERLQKTISERTQKLQSLLEQEEVAVDQVFHDYAQAVLATAWDEYNPHPSTSQGSPKSQGIVQTNETFEQMTAKLVETLQQRHAQWHPALQAEAIQVTVETQKLSELPAHALTYIKLLITGNKMEVQGPDLLGVG